MARGERRRAALLLVLALALVLPAAALAGGKKGADDGGKKGGGKRSSEVTLQDAVATGIPACDATGHASSSASSVTGAVTYDSDALPWDGQVVPMSVVIGTANTTCLQDREGVNATTAQRFGVELILPRGAKLVPGEAGSGVSCHVGPKEEACPGGVALGEGAHGGVQLSYEPAPDGRFLIGPFTQMRLSFRVRMTRGFDGVGKKLPHCGHHRTPCSAEELRNFAEVVVEADERAAEPTAHHTISALLPLLALRLTPVKTQSLSPAEVLQGMTLTLTNLPAKGKLAARLYRGKTTIATRSAATGDDGGEVKLKLLPRAAAAGRVSPGAKLKLRLTLTAPGVIRQTATSVIHVR
jgi:hypothetical protein